VNHDWADATRRIIAAPALLLGVNFDGTLTPLIDRPEHVQLNPEVRQTLRDLARRPSLKVAVASGRALADLQQKIGLPGLYYVGNHGLEIAGPGVTYVEPSAQSHRDLVGEISAVLASRLGHLPGVWIEEKGLTAAVHYRQASPDASDEVRRIVHNALAQNHHPFQLSPSQKAFDIRPRVYWNKGSAITWLRDQIGMPDALTVYVGDDVTDEDAFGALAEGVTVKVGRAEQSAATYQLDGPADVLRFLKWLLEHWKME
jgi:trehalose-phosphatase